jgi:hypothetical protein
MRDMTVHDRMRLKAHRTSHRLFKKLVEGGSDGLATQVCDLTATEWKSLRTLIELGYVNIDNGAIIIEFTVSSLAALDYV